MRDLREKYLRFFESKGHFRFPSGSLIPYDVTGRLDESLLFNGAGMIQFKPYFRGLAQPENKRLITVQKCVRTGDIEEVGDDTHLTFFEMMGNFSFGDYFKSQAIAYSWEFLTGADWLALDPKRLSFSVFEEDDEAYAEWDFWITPAGIDTATRVFRLGEDTNYWPAGSFSKGPPGPCGPNSEMFYWGGSEEPPSGPYTKEDWLRDESAGKWLEIWNDVFIQFDWEGHLRNPDRPADGYQKDGMPELPFRSVDTGMGLERTAIVLGGHKSIYDIDVFQPILRSIEGVSGTVRYGDSFEKDQAMRIIADHIRTSVFCISGGILPSNNGRGYVLRRLIRRAVLKGQRVLGFDKPFFHIVFDGVVDAMGSHYTELEEQREVIVKTLQDEEALFRKTLSTGSGLLQTELDGLDAGSTLLGETAFRLYDTFGFPLEVTIEIADEAGISVDVDGYEKALKEAQERSRGGQEREAVYSQKADVTELAVTDAPLTTEFFGYECTSGAGRIVRMQVSGEENGSATKVKVALDRTPFYAESGGQTGDHGIMIGDGFTIKVINTHKVSGVFWHDGEIQRTKEIPLQALLGQTVDAQVLAERRASIVRNHTATHLLQAALRQVLGTHVNQAGSYVGPDNLRFDFTHGKGMSQEEVGKVERIVNEQALANTAVQVYADLPIAEAKGKGAMALFGEKYGDRVRMVEVGDFSRELCGGVHVRTTGEIGLFKIVSESSAASGVRRIEAITGESAYNWVLEQTRRLREAAELVKSSPADLVPAVQKTLDSLRDEKRRREKAEMAAVSGRGAAADEEGNDVEQVGAVRVWFKNFGEVDQKIAAQGLDNRIASNPDLVGVIAVVADGKVTFICKCGSAAVAAGAHAGNIVREVAKIAGGGGGGRPEFATAGGKLPEKANEAIAAAPSIVKDLLK